MYILTEEEKRTTERLVGVMKDTIQKTNPDKVMSYIDRKIDKMNISRKKKADYLAKQGFDVKSLNQKAKILGKKLANKEISIKSILETMGEWWEEGKKHGSNKTSVSIFVSMIFQNIMMSLLYGIGAVAFTYTTGSIGLLAPMAIKFFLVCIIAPITEELAKKVSIEYDNTAKFWRVFNIFEAVIVYILPHAIGLVVNMFLGASIFWSIANLGIFIVARFVCVMFHTLTTKIQVDQTNKGNPDKGLCIGMLLHFIVNLFAILVPAGSENLITSSKWLSIGVIFDLSFMWIVSKIYTKLTSKKEEEVSTEGGEVYC